MTVGLNIDVYRRQKGLYYKTQDYFFSIFFSFDILNKHTG